MFYLMVIHDVDGDHGDNDGHDDGDDWPIKHIKMIPVLLIFVHFAIWECKKICQPSWIYVFFFV